jgi:DNA-binding response OmpR family regulator
MKILHVANDRHAAQLAANALRDIAQDVRVAWAGSLSVALSWVQGNRDVAAIIVESGVQNESCQPFVARVRALGLTVPIVVVAPEHGEATVSAAIVGPETFVRNSRSLLADLPEIVRRGLAREPETHPSSGPTTRAPEQASAASQGDAQIRALLEQERTLRQTLEAKLTDAATALKDA